MKRYLRPLGILSGRSAREAVAAGLALPLAGGPLAFTLVEAIERDGAKIERRIVSSTSPLEGEVGPKVRAGGSRSELAQLSVARRWDHYPPPVDAVRRRPPPQVGRHFSEVGAAPIVMGIVNATPDSFSDGGLFFDPAKATAHAEAMIRAGAGFVDIGGESTRPGALAVDPEEEIRRVLPVIAGLRDIAAAAGVTISIDTRNARTMQAALAAGAGMINDVSALTHDPESPGVAARSNVPVVLMHMRGEPATMQAAPVYDDVALDVYDYLEARIAAAEAAGIARSRLAIDPGIGFGKTAAHNLALLDQLGLFHGLGVPVLVGVSRKGFIAGLSGGEPADQRLGGSLALGLAAIGQGAQILRVHDVQETAQAIRLTAALRDA